MVAAGADTGKGSKLLTLTEVSKRTGISMPTLQRYKKEYADRIPSEGEGRKQRYPMAALRVFRQIKKENLAKRGRPPKVRAEGEAPAKKKSERRKPAKKKAAKKAPAKKAPAKKAAAKPAPAESESGFSLLQISKRTGIEYTRLQRLVKKNLDQIPTVGDGRTRRYMDGAMETLKALHAETPHRIQAAKKKVRRAARAQVKAIGLDEAGLQRKVEALEEVNTELKRDLAQLRKDMNGLVRTLKKTIRISVLK